MKLMLDDFKLIRDFINDTTGMYFREEKLYFLESRIEARCKETNCRTVHDYYRMLKYSSSALEFDTFIESLTINETYFFRDAKQLNALAHEALPQIVERKKQSGSMRLNILSAGCSTGEEPYTLAIILSEFYPQMFVNIFATDINNKVLNIAKRGIYSGRSLKDMPAEYLDKYFDVDDDGFKVKELLRRIVNFQNINLIDKQKMLSFTNMDIILCRNVLIYFEQGTAAQIVNYLYDDLNKGGFIFLGLAESMHLLSGAFSLVKFSEMYGYQKK
jgi:chemotaxis protein methyltransferase CheR